MLTIWHLFEISGWSWSSTCCFSPLGSWGLSPGPGLWCLPTPCLFPTTPWCFGDLCITPSPLSWGYLSARAWSWLQCRHMYWDTSPSMWLYTTSCHQPHGSLWYWNRWVLRIKYFIPAYVCCLLPQALLSENAILVRALLIQYVGKWENAVQKWERERESALNLLNLNSRIPYE